MIIRNEVAWGIITLLCAIFIGAMFGIPMALLVLFGVLIAWWAWQYPEESFLVFIVLAPLLPLLKATQTLGSITLMKDVIIIILFLRTFVVPLLTKQLPYRKNALFAPIIALSAWACFEVLRAGVTTLSVLRLRDIMLYILLYFGVLYLPHSAAILKKRFLWLLATLTVVIALGVFQMQFAQDSTVLRFDPVRQVWIPRMASTFGHPTVLAEYVITAQVLLLGIMLTMWRKLQRYERSLCTILFILTLPVLYLTYTRAGWIGFVVAVVAMGVAYLYANPLQLPLRKGESNDSPPYEGGARGGYITRVIVSVVIICAFAFAAIRFTPIGTFLRTAIDPTYASNADRIGFVVQLISQTSNMDAIIGKGLGNVITEVRQGGDVTTVDIASGDARTVQLSKDQTLVDNQYLKTFMEMGVVGLTFTFWLFWRFFRAARQSKRLYLAGIGFLAAFMVQALFVDIWDVFPTNAIFWVIAALL